MKFFHKRLHSLPPALEIMEEALLRMARPLVFLAFPILPRLFKECGSSVGIGNTKPRSPNFFISCPSAFLMFSAPLFAT